MFLRLGGLTILGLARAAPNTFESHYIRVGDLLASGEWAVALAFAVHFTTKVFNKAPGNTFRRHP
jgi:hypothetical protein